jgi:diguanylate cyclase (GGDEF)-like protein/PAS domain S-box-containing protein
MPLPSLTASKSLRAQWLWLALALAILGGAIALDLYLERARAEAIEKDRLVTQARVIAANMEHQLQSARLVLKNVRDGLPAWKKSSDPRAATTQLNALVNAMPGIRFIGVVDKQGLLRASNLTEFVGQDFSYRDYFQKVKIHPRADVLYVSPPFKSAAGVYVLNITRMIEGPRGEFAGVVTASLDPEYFKVLMRSVLYAPDMWDALAHGDGTLFLMEPGRDELHGMNLAQPGSLFTQHRDSGQMVTVLEGTVYSTGEERMMAQHTILPDALKMDQPLVVAVSRDLEAVFQPWQRTVLTQASLFGLFVIVSVMGLYSYQRRHRRLEQQATDARALADRFGVALDHIPTYIYMKDQQRRYVYANRATLELFGCSADELKGSVDARFFPPQTVAQIHGIDTKVLEGGEDNAEEVIAQAGDGKRRVYWEIKTPIYEDAAKTRIWGLCGISTDITEREMMKEALEQQAHQDYLTGLCNRRYFMELGQAELERAQRYSHALSVLMLDIDHFKGINDSHGHKAGDLVLQRLADVMRETLRTMDIIGRISGEEFAVLLPETDLQQAAEVAERLRANVAGTDVVLEAGMPLHFTVSIGVARLEDRDINLDILLNQADKALYRAKESGRDKVCVA